MRCFYFISKTCIQLFLKMKIKFFFLLLLLNFDQYVHGNNNWMQSVRLPVRSSRWRSVFGFRSYSITCSVLEFDFARTEPDNSIFILWSFFYMLALYVYRMSNPFVVLLWLQVRPKLMVSDDREVLETVFVHHFSCLFTCGLFEL